MAPARAAYRTFRQEQLPMSDLKARHQVIQLNCQVGHLTAGSGGLTGACRALDR